MTISITVSSVMPSCLSFPDSTRDNYVAMFMGALNEMEPAFLLSHGVCKWQYGCKIKRLQGGNDAKLHAFISTRLINTAYCGETHRQENVSHRTVE
jgi:hypothetical protein